MVVELPSGTVSLLFSDIEGSTVLLSRLGTAYAEALDGQRQVLRAAWAAHGGTELGTEGDSFFVVFETARAAVAAAAQAQRELAVYPWPAGERVRVRMGIHTGSPQPHDGGYVGMDVHRAARIAGSAHGGQVVLSAATASLLDGCAPSGASLRDLGSHRLKDIAATERLFQLVVEGLPSEFPALKTLGTASSLPVPASALVGRVGELAELTALLGQPEVRLVTLTGPGGSGKTRLAISLSRGLVQSFDDGVFFVPLATVTSPAAMWTSIGGVLDVSADQRDTVALLAHLAHRSALFVLDNLEQLPGAEHVVAEVLAAAPKVVVIATSRRPLHLVGEHEHPVPTLQLPDRATLDEIERTGAVQMFVQHARMARPSFALTEKNAADVVQVCRALDGLPLAIELAAARTRLLSPAALAARLARDLELKDTAVDRPTRHQTLRATIGWSHDLLTAAQQIFFRRLGVFAGGADLDAVAAVTVDELVVADPLDLLADLVDASLVTITEEEASGEPRIGMLETIRAFANQQLAGSGELDTIRKRHAHHHLAVAQELTALPTRRADQVLDIRRRFELEHDNIRAALNWALRPDDPEPPSADHAQPGIQLCAACHRMWFLYGYGIEGRRWLERAIDVAGDRDSVELAECLSGLSWACRNPEDLDRGHELANRCVSMCRRLGDQAALSSALLRLAGHEDYRGDYAAAQRAAEEAVAIARTIDDDDRLASATVELAFVAGDAGDLERCLELDLVATDLYLELGDEIGVLNCRHNVACDLRMLGRLEEAQRQMRDLIPEALRGADRDHYITVAEDYGAVLAELGEHEPAARLLGSADATRERNGDPRTPAQAAEIAGPFAKAREALSPQDWDREYGRGFSMTADEALAEAYTASPD